MNQAEYRLIIFDKDTFSSHTANSIATLLPLIQTDKNNWLQLSNFALLPETENTELENKLGVHQLLQRDIRNTRHLPKLEEHEEALFITLKHISQHENSLHFDHISLLLHKHLLISFSLSDQQRFEPIVQRLEQNKGRGRKQKTDYLLYLLLDLIIDDYYPQLEKMREEIEQTELEMLRYPGYNYLPEIMALKKHHHETRRLIAPLSEVVLRLRRHDTILIRKQNTVYYNDLQDHVDFLLNSLDNLREMLANLRDLNSANQNDAMNRIMKTLTVVSTIFIPLTFIAGIYGMNFHHMPELDKPWAYPAVWALMILIAATMILFMKRRDWF